jgi:DNA-directed RNA polymerase subunit beta'
VLDVNNFDQLRIGLATAEDIRMWSTARSRSPRPSTTARSSPRRTGSSARRSSARPRTGSATAASTSACASRASSASAAASRSPGPRCAASAWATSSSPPPSCTSGTSRAPEPAGLPAGTGPEEKEQLEKVIYFAANLVTWVDVDQRHADLPEPRGRDRGRAKKEIENRARARHRGPRHEELEAELASSRPRAPRADIKRRAARRREGDDRQIRERYDQELDRLERSGTSSRPSRSRQTSRATRCSGAS